MKKVKLELDQLKIDSFETAKIKSDQGTVKGFMKSINIPCEITDIMGCPTYKISCELICP